MAKHVVVIGGGISGLAATHRLIELREKCGKDFTLSLFEAGSRFGGVIQTKKKDGFLLESGPDSFISEKPWALDLSRRLGLENEIIGTRTENRRSFVVQKDRLIPVPSGFYLIAPTELASFLKSPLFSVKGKLRIFLERWLPKSRVDEDESIGSFVRRRFGKEALHRVGQAMLAGIYTGDPDHLSILATLPRFKELEKKYGSVTRGLLCQSAEKKSKLSASGPRYGLFLSYKQGMQTLVDGLLKRLPAEMLKTGSAAKHLHYDRAQSQWNLNFSDGTEIKADAVCLALPPQESARLLENTSSPLSRKFRSIRSESVLTVNVAYKRSAIEHALDGFGFVVPASEKPGVFAATFCDQKYEGRAPAGHSLIRAFVGGVFGKEHWQKPDKEIEFLVQKDLGRMLGVREKPLFSSLERYPSSMVQYGLGHLNLVSSIRRESQQMKNLFLTGAALSGIGIPDCVHHAETQAEALLAYL